MLYLLSSLAMIGAIIFFHLDNLSFCRKMDLYMKLSKEGHSKEAFKVANSL